MPTLSEKKLKSYSYLGGIHIHSTFSDGSGDIEKISLAAKSAGLDWIIITDHNSMDIQEGFYNGILAIKGEEISPEKSNHYLALGIENNITAPDPSSYIEEVRSQQGFGFAAHPDESETRQNPYVPIRWTDKNILPDGVEIWNWFSEWADNFSSKNVFSKAYAYLFKHNLVKGANPQTINWWDKLNNINNNIIPAIGGIDAHALKIPGYILPVTVFPYKSMFITITNVITLKEPLSEDFQTAKSQVLNAIKSGNNFVINRKVSKNIPVFKIKNKTGEAHSGESIELDNNTILTVKAAPKCSIKVFHNGEEIMHNISDKLKIILDRAGKYRVEIKIGNKGFAYSNPVLVY